MSEHRGGPVRSEAARVAVLDATARLFGTRGYDHLTMEGIATEAGVAKQTIYRWWTSKGAIVADCLLEGRLLRERFLPEDTGDVRADFAAWLSRIFGLLQEPQGEVLLRSLIAAAAENAEVGKRLRETLGAASVVTVRLQKAIESGELRADAPPEEIVEALVGAVILRALSREPADADVVARLLRATLGDQH